jgi:hypothetical protein
VSQSGFSRPTTASHHADGSETLGRALINASAHNGSATSKSRPTSRPKKSSGVTPTISKGWPVQREHASESGSLAAQLATPEGLADDDAGRSAAGPIVRSRKQPPGDRPDAKHVEEAAD